MGEYKISRFIRFHWRVWAVSAILVGLVVLAFYAGLTQGN